MPSLRPLPRACEGNAQLDKLQIAAVRAVTASRCHAILGSVGRPRSAQSPAAGLSVLAILALIVLVTTKQAWPIFRDGFGFITGTKWDPANTSGRCPSSTALPFLLIVLLRLLSPGIALTNNELARRFRKPVIYAIDLLAATSCTGSGARGVRATGQPVSDTAVRSARALFGGQASTGELHDRRHRAVMIIPSSLRSAAALATVQDDRTPRSRWGQPAGRCCGCACSAGAAG
jgi:hypothetical protein